MSGILMYLIYKLFITILFNLDNSLNLNLSKLHLENITSVELEFLHVINILICF